MLEASGTHIPSWGWGAAGAIGAFLAMWGTVEIVVRVASRTMARLRLPKGRTFDEISSEAVRKRRSEALAFLLYMNWHHGHMDMEGVQQAVRTGVSLGEGQCRVCGRPRAAAGRQPSIGILVTH